MALKDLPAACDTFMELKGNLEEGIKFYDDLTQKLITFRKVVNDFCVTRKTEKESSTYLSTAAATSVVSGDPVRARIQPRPPQVTVASTSDDFVSSVRSSSVYHGLLHIRKQATFSNFSNSSDSKVKVKVKGPNMCYIFEKHGIQGYQI